MFAHFTREMGQHLVLIVQFDPKHCARHTVETVPSSSIGSSLLMGLEGNQKEASYQQDSSPCVRG